MNRIAAVVAGLSLAFVGTSATIADTINVPGDYATIQEAIDASANGDVINIAAGTYGGASITQSGITIIGSVDTNDVEMPDTVITSPIVLFGVQNVSLERLLISFPASPSPPQIENFDDVDPISVGLRDSGNIEFKECVFKACGQGFDQSGTTWIVEQGGAVYIDQTSASFTSCKFIGNRAAVQGGAIFVTRPAPGTHFVDCSFEGNACSQMGGAFSTDHHWGTHTFDGCNFSGNSSLNSDLNTSFGGAIFATGGNTLFMDNSNFTNNSSGRGGACYATNSSSFVRSGTTFSNNVGKICGGAMFLELSYCEVEDANFCNNEPDHIVGGWIDEGNNSFADECTSDDTEVCLGDTNQDYNVDILDLLFIIAIWGSDNPAGDINNDGWVNVNDMLELLDNWGAICE